MSKPGGQIGNRNALKHGTRTILTSGRMPAGCGYIGRQVKALRSALNAEIAARHDGEISLLHGCYVQSAMRHEQRAMLLQRWLRETSDLSLDYRISLLREISAATDSRDKCLRAIGLDKDAADDVWATYYAKKTETDTHGSDDDDDEAAEHETPGGPPVGPAAGTG
jgi:hypothetical protein